MKIYLFLLLLPAFILSSCATAPDTYTPDSDIVTLKFDAQGNLVNKDAYEGLRKDIALHRQTVAIFVHGWKGSAAPSDFNWKGVEENLTTIRDRTYKPAGRKLTVVYVTWPASALPGAFENFHYGGAEGTADSIAHAEGLADVIKGLSEAMPRNSGEKFVVLGHSMGARIIGRVIGNHPQLLQKIDLVLCINSAEGRSKGQSVMNQVSSHSYPLRAMPRMVWITSEADRATGFDYPLVEGETTIGHSPDLLTHRADLTPAKDGKPAKVDFVQLKTPAPMYYRNILIHKTESANHCDIWREPMRVILNYCLWEHPYGN